MKDRNTLAFAPDGTKSGTIECHHEDGTLHFKESWANGQKHGYFEYNWSDGKPFYKGHYICGEQHGWWEEYWSDGRTRYAGYYDMGQKTFNKTDVRDKMLEIVMK